ncbi:Gfo/Idh/MocA family oxidoreductase [Micromonospora sp. BRA006-A]|nr:Gfo/Idh/MocA family oxidoreductase [Micromonospora sp. BRA006-A]
MTARPPAAAGRPVRVAVVGLGWGRREIWLPRLAAHPGFEVVAVVDPQPVVRDQAHDTHAVASAYADVEDLPAGTVDLAVVAVPNHLHAVVAVRLLRRGVPVFLEKPVCLTSAEAGILADAGARRRRGAAGRQRRRYRADDRALADVAAGWADPARRCGLGSRPRVPDAGGWFTRRDQSGGGALVDLGWHLLDTVLPLLGPARVTHAIGSVSDDFVNDSAAHAAWRGGADTAGHVPGDVEDTARGSCSPTPAPPSPCTPAGPRTSRWTAPPSPCTAPPVGDAALHLRLQSQPRAHAGADAYPRRPDRAAAAAREPIGAEYDHQLDALPGLLADPAARGAAVVEARRTIDIIERIYQCARPTRPERQHALVGHRAG